MREIKFRGKRLDNGEWLHGSLIRRIDRTEIFDDVFTWEVDPATVGQFTGLFDKNGNDIYEGDIVNAVAEQEYAMNTCVSDVICDTKCGSQFCIRHVAHEIHSSDIMFGLHIGWGGWESLTVLGNIHDNPELLKPE